MDYDLLLYNPIYDVLGVPAELQRVAGFAVTITVMDKTRGFTVVDAVGVETIRPAAMVRMSELNALGIAFDELTDASLELNGRTWQIKHWQEMQAPAGKAVGEIVMILMDSNDGR